jgi:hypothetical protein
VQPFVPIGEVGEAVWSALGATAAALVLARTLHLEELFAGKPVQSENPDQVIADLVDVAAAVKQDGHASLSASRSRAAHPDLTFGVGLVATGVDPILVRVAMQRRLDASGRAVWPGPVVSRFVGAGAMFAGSTGLMLIRPGAATLQPAWLFLLVGCIVGGMALIAASHLIEGSVEKAGGNAGLRARLLTEGITAIAAGRDPSHLETDLRRLAGQPPKPERALNRAA